MPVVAVLLDSMRSHHAQQFVVVEKSPHRKVAKRHTAPSQAVELEGTAQEPVKLLEHIFNDIMGGRDAAQETLTRG